MATTFRFFRVNPLMDLWEDIKEIRKLQEKGVLVEECPSPDYWEFRVKDFEKMPDDLVKKIISTGNYLT